MINARQSLKSAQQGDDINIAPLIDLIFLLLIFFMVTTSFVKETGIDVDRPSAATAQVQKKGNILIGVSAEGGIFMDKRAVDVRMVRTRVENALADNPLGSAIIVADRHAQAGILVEIMDQCRMAGVRNVSIAAKQNGGIQ